MTIEETIIQRVRQWLAREAPRVRDDDVQASIKFTIMQPREDEDGTLVLELRAEETADTYYDECAGLRVDGLAFEPVVVPEQEKKR